MLQNDLNLPVMQAHPISANINQLQEEIDVKAGPPLDPHPFPFQPPACIVENDSYDKLAHTYI